MKKKSTWYQRAMEIVYDSESLPFLLVIAVGIGILLAGTC